MEFRKFLNENNKVESILRKEFPEVRLVMTETNEYIILTVILIQEKRRNKGEAKAFMKRLIELSSKYKKDIYLTPSDIYGGDLNRLTKFYKSLGFIKNTNPSINEKLFKKYES